MIKFSSRNIYIDFESKKIKKDDTLLYKKLALKDLNSLLKCINFFKEKSYRYSIISSFKFKKILYKYVKYINCKFRIISKSFNTLKSGLHIDNVFKMQGRKLKITKYFAKKKTKNLRIFFLRYIKLKRLIFNYKRLHKKKKLKFFVKKVNFYVNNKKKNKSKIFKYIDFNFMRLLNIFLKKIFLYKVNFFRNSNYKNFIKATKKLIRLFINLKVKTYDLFFKYKNYKKLDIKLLLTRKKKKLSIIKNKTKFIFRRKHIFKKKTFRKLIKNVFFLKKKTGFFFKLNNVRFVKRFLNKLFLKFMNKGNKNFIKRMFFSFLIFVRKKYFKIKKKKLSFNFLYLYINQILIKSTPSLNFMFKKKKGNFIKIPRVYISDWRICESNMSLALIWLKKSILNRPEKNIFLKLISEFESIRVGKSDVINLRKNYYFEIKSNLRKVWKKKRHF